MQQWKKLPQNEIKKRVFTALSNNVDYYNQNIIGLPASHLDDKVFYQNAPFLEDAPYLSTLIHNPNHIGCHTLGESESFFKGTQEIEKEVIHICANNILKGKEENFDGYIASGGTEANMQAVWIYRNYFMKKHQATLNEIAIISSSDAHYSSAKAGNVFQISFYKVQVDDTTREFNEQSVTETLEQAKAEGKKYFVVVANMMTTMFGSVDNIDAYISALESMDLLFKVHVDGAYGGFFYPFAKPDNPLNFSNPKVNYITLDAHKMLQAPYGTGIFLIRKGWMNYANTQEASYVEGEDFTLIGSRSGANAIAIWMILMTYGPNGWFEKTLVLNHRATWLAEELDKRKIAYYRHPDANIVTIEAGFLKKEVCKKFGLVPDSHKSPKWYKIVIMDHVSIEKLQLFLEEV